MVGVGVDRSPSFLLINSGALSHRNSKQRTPPLTIKAESEAASSPPPSSLRPRPPSGDFLSCPPKEAAKDEEDVWGALERRVLRLVVLGGEEVTLPTGGERGEGI